MAPPVLFAFVPPATVLKEARARFAVVPEEPADLTTEAVLLAAQKWQPEGLLIWAHQKLDAEAVQALPASLKIIATCSVGYDHVNVQAAKARNIVVTNTPDVLTDCTADFAILLILAACRRIREGAAVIEKGWGTSLGMHALLGLRVSGRTLGILGMGRIGQATARRARAFGMRVLYTNRQRLAPDKEEGATFVPRLHDLLPQSEILSLHAPATTETHAIINADALARLPRGAVLVNTARGTLVDEDALVAALQSGHLFAAGLDVMQHEPHLNPALAALPNAFLMPHIGSATVETRHAMGMKAVENAQAVLRGAAPIDPVW